MKLSSLFRVALISSTLVAFKFYIPFKESLEVEITEDYVRALSNNTEIKASFGTTEINAVEFISQRGITGATTLQELEIITSPSKLNDQDSDASRRLVLNPALYLHYPDFRRTFGDWSLDNFNSLPALVTEGTFITPFNLKAILYGRGQKIVRLRTNTGTIDISLRSGRINNDIAICRASDCSVSAELRPDAGASFLRLSGFFALLFGSALILLLIFESVRPVPAASKGNVHIAWLAGATAFLHALICLWFNSAVLGGIPHLPDSALYYRQALLLSHGHLGGIEAPAHPAQSFVTHSVSVNGEVLNFLQSNRFWPLILAIPARLGLAGFVNPLMSGFIILLIFQLGRHFFGDKEAVISSILWAFSPFAIILGGSFMAHTSALFFLLHGVWLTIQSTLKFTRLRCLAAGMSLAIAFAIRPLSTAAVVSSLAACVLWKKFEWRKLIFFAVGATPILLLLAFDNYLITGNPLHLPAAVLYPQSFAFSNLPLGLRNIDVMLDYLCGILFFYPASLAILALSCFSLIRTRYNAAIFVWISFLLVLILHAFLNIHGLHGYGPRFLFEVSAFLMFPAGAAIVWLFSHSNAHVGRLAQLVFAGIMVFSAFELVKILPSYKNYNGITQNLYQSLKALDPARSIVFIADTRWQSSEAGAVLFDPTFKGLIMVRDKDAATNTEILQQFADRKPFVVRGGVLSSMEDLK